jgi:hypothetical protein
MIQEDKDQTIVIPEQILQMKRVTYEPLRHDYDSTFQRELFNVLDLNDLQPLKDECYVTPNQINTSQLTAYFREANRPVYEADVLEEMLYGTKEKKTNDRFSPWINSSSSISRGFIKLVDMSDVDSAHVSETINLLNSMFQGTVYKKNEPVLHSAGGVLLEVDIASDCSDDSQRCGFYDSSNEDILTDRILTPVRIEEVNPTDNMQKFRPTTSHRTYVI